MSGVVSFILKFLTEIITAVGAYAIGNFNPAIIISKKNGVDIWSEGSGNPGTTNVIRTIGIKAGMQTLFLDMLKAFIAVKLGFMFSGPLGGQVAFAGVLLGHCFPVIYKFKGGKGVAAAFGAALGISWCAATVAFIVAVIVLCISKKMSLGSLVAAIAFPPLILFYSPEYFIFSLFVAAFLIVMHIPNITRLKNGEESSIDIVQKIREMR